MILRSDLRVPVLGQPGFLRSVHEIDHVDERCGLIDEVVDAVRDDELGVDRPAPPHARDREGARGGLKLLDAAAHGLKPVHSAIRAGLLLDIVGGLIEASMGGWIVANGVHRAAHNLRCNRAAT